MATVNVKAVNVKAFLEKNGEAKGEIRRFQLSAQGGDGSDGLYAALRAKVADVFNISAFQMWWQDSDGDNVTFSSDAELLEALSNVTDSLLRVYVKTQKGGSDKPSASAGASPGDSKPGASEGEKVRHPGVICDGCETDLYGPRFKCVVCPDYDLCQRCEDKGLHPEHDKFKITHPNTAGGHGFMPHHFRHFMNHMMGRQGGGGPCSTGATSGTGATAGASASASSSASSSSSSSSSSRCGSGSRQWGRGRCGGRWRRGQGCTMGNGGNGGNPQDEYLKNIGENIQAFLDPFGVDVTYEVHHGDQKQSGQFSTSDQAQANADGTSSGSGSFSGPFGPGAWQWNMFGNAGGCTRMPQQSATTGETTEADKQAAEKAAEAAAKRAEKQSGKKSGKAPKHGVEVAEEAKMEAGAEVEMEIPVTTEPASPPAAPQEPPRQKEPSPSGSNDEDWTMLNSGDTVDGPAVASAPGNGQGEWLYPNLKVAQAVEMMKNMGFNDNGSWLTRLLISTDGDIVTALDKLKLGAEQANRLATK